MAKRLSVKQAQLLQRHKYILAKLANSSVKDRRTILRHAPSDLFKVLDLIFKLIANDDIGLSKRQKIGIKKHKRFIRSTSGLGTKAIKGKLVRQTGGMLPAILSIILPLIGAVVKAVI